MAIDKRFLYYTSEAGFLSDKNDGNISDSSIAFISVGGKKAIYTHGVFFSSEAFVVGTQTAATNAFTGTLNEIEKLYDGLSIKYWLPENGTTSDATLNLNINGTQTGAIPVYIKGTTRFTSNISKNNVLHLTYRENVGSIAKGWWVLGSFGDKADGDTKYSFTSGTDGSFKVKASDGSAEQTISIGKPEEAGTADVAKKVEKAFTLQVNSGSTEYEDLYTFDGSTAKTINIKQGSNIKIETADGEVSISGNYSAASQSAAGLMSSTDKKKLDGIEDGANKYTHPEHDEANLDLYKIKVDAEGHVESTTKVTKSDITSLGIPSADTHYTSKNVVGSSTAISNTTTALSNGNVYLNSVENGAVTSSHKISGSGNTTVKTDASGNIEINSPTTIAWGSVTGKPGTFAPSAHNHVVSEITDLETQKLTFNGTEYLIYTPEATLPTFYAPSTLGSNGQVLKSDGTKVYWAKDNNDNTWRSIALTDGTTDTSVLGTGTDTGSLKFKAGSNVNLSASDGIITVSATDTTYDLATSSKAGIVTIGNTAGKANGTASAGTTTGGKAAAVDHVHPLQTSVSGNAGTATKLASKVDITLGGDVTGTAEFDGSEDITITTTVGNDSHSHSNSTITSVDASKITSGTISIDRLPHGALERLTVVTNDTARFALTTDNIQLGDTVKVTATGLMYFVKDTDNLANENGYEIYTAGGATSVPWSGITGKPTEFTPSAHSHAFTPAGTVSSTFTGTAHEHTFTGTAASHNHSFTGTEVTSGEASDTTSVYSITGVGTLPKVTMPSVSVTYDAGTLTITHTAGSYTAGTLPTRSSVTVASSDHTHTVTASGTVGNKSITPVGTISEVTTTGTIESTFTGTAGDVNSTIK